MLAQRNYGTQLLLNPTKLSSQENNRVPSKSDSKESPNNHSLGAGDPPGNPDPSGAVFQARVEAETNYQLHKEFVSACYRNDTKIVGELLLNRRDEITPSMLNAGLHSIINFNYHTLMETLMYYGASPNALSGDTKQSPLHIISFASSGDSIDNERKLDNLFRHGADANIKNDKGETALESLLSNRSSYYLIHRFVKYALKKGLKLPKDFDLNSNGYPGCDQQPALDLAGRTISGVKFHPGNGIEQKNLEGTTFIACDFSSLDPRSLLINDRNFRGAKILGNTNAFPKPVNPVRSLGMEVIDMELGPQDLQHLENAPLEILVNSSGFPKSISCLKDREYALLKKILLVDPKIRENPAELMRIIPTIRKRASDNQNLV